MARILIGVLWLFSLRWKLPPSFEPSSGSGERGLREWLELEVEFSAFGFYGDLIDSVVLPNFTFFAWLVFLTELFVGLSLLTGGLVRVGAIVGLALSLNLGIGLLDVPGEVALVVRHVGHVARTVLCLRCRAGLGPGFETQQRKTAMTDTENAQNRAIGVEGAALHSSGRSLGLAILRVTLGAIILVTWFSNLDKDLYTGDGLTGLISWLFSEDGNNSSLGFYESLLDTVVVPNAGLVSKVQLVVELGMGIGLILGLFTRFFSLASLLFFISLFLGYYGGNEWIWTYVILAASALAVFLGYAGRSFGVDRLLAKARGESPLGLIW